MTESQQHPLVTIITVNYNQTGVTCELLESLRHISYPNIEVIVVDNASPDEDPSEMKTRFPEISLIISKKNLGFAGGNNLGILQAKGEYLLFINNDTEVPVDFLEPMIIRLLENPELGMISPKIRFHHSPSIIQFAGYTPLNPYTLRQELIGYRQEDKGQHDESIETFSIHGAAMMVPMKVVKQVGLMADIYFLYYEEHDWAFRIKREGYKVFYEAGSLVYHKESISTGKESPLKIYYISRNRILFARRNYSGLVFIFNLIYLTLIAVPKNSLVYIIKGRFDLFKALWKAIFWNFTHYRGLDSNPTLSG
jgi:GT2 family glycosyltransferase